MNTDILSDIREALNRLAFALTSGASFNEPAPTIYELLRQLRNDVGELRRLLSAKLQGPLPLEADKPAINTPPVNVEQIKRDWVHAAESLKNNPSLSDDAKALLDIAATAGANAHSRLEMLRQSPFYVADDEREVILIAKRPKFEKAYGLARIGADACCRLPDGSLDVKAANQALYDAFRPLVEGELLPPPPADYTDTNTTPVTSGTPTSL